MDSRRFALPGERRLARAIEDALVLVEDLIREELHFADGLADASGRYLLEAGGKRIRPVLALLTAQLGEGATPEVVRAAAAIEITHLASLYHDDVMDEAAVRRGVPAAHTVFGNSVAIITGDLLFARASRMVADLGLDALRMQADTFERLCLGQLHETTGPAGGEDPIAHYVQVLADKTGSLIAAAAESGLRFSGADAAHIPAVRAYGERVGIAFQLADDVIDITDARERTGKAPGTDLLAGVPTMPMLLLQRAAAEGDSGAADLLGRLDAAIDLAQSEA
ncbi:MAG: polyprenyl synthetase family protein, partial [Microbacteriaceae bacterium]|nr:polyprenyl synthetase family protein [Microbacteriaceae bacterium]